MIKDELKIKRRPGMCCANCVNALLDYEACATCALDGGVGVDTDICDNFCAFGDDDAE